MIPGTSVQTTDTMVDQVKSVQNPEAAPVVVIPDSQVAPGQVQPDGSAAVVPEATPQASPDQAPPLGESALAKLAQAEKRVQDTQAWGHKKAEEAAKLKQDLITLYNHPVIGQAIKAALEGKVADPQTGKEDPDLVQEWNEYQTATSDKDAFEKLLKFAEQRSLKQSQAHIETTLREREAKAVAARRNMAVAKTIEQTVTSIAPDVPVELFWAVSARAQAETPPDLVESTDIASRLEWQTNRAIEIARGIIARQAERMKTNREAAVAVTTSGQEIMAPGGGSPKPGTSIPAAQPTMVEQIKARQRTLFNV